MRNRAFQDLVMQALSAGVALFTTILAVVLTNTKMLGPALTP